MKKLFPDFIILGNLYLWTTKAAYAPFTNFNPPSGSDLELYLLTNGEICENLAHNIKRQVNDNRYLNPFLKDPPPVFYTEWWLPNNVDTEIFKTDSKNKCRVNNK